MSGEKHGSPNENDISRPTSPQNRSQAIRYQTSSEQELVEQRSAEDNLDLRHSGSDAIRSVPLAGTEEASEQPLRLRTNKDPSSAESGTTRDVAPGQAGHNRSLRTTAAETSRISLARPPLSIDTGPATAESNLVCNFKTYSFPSCISL